ncbi:MAG: VOC family protein [Candidatus Saccharimonadales bacterium]|jgi:predicted enzyme related to lactoylglutathione lyase
MAQIVHFEITADDITRALQFYKIFDWTITDADMPGVDYWLVNTGTKDPTKNGAIMPRSYQSQPTIIWIGVKDLDAMIDKVKQAGGKIVGQKQTIPEVGDTIYAVDTEGNTFGMIQTLPMK